MFANEKSIDNLEALFRELKNYISLQKEYATLQLVENLAVIVSTLLLIAVLVILGSMALFYLTFMLAYYLKAYTGSMMGSYAVIAIALVALTIIVYIYRRRLILQPMINFIARLFFENKNNNPQQ